MSALGLRERRDDAERVKGFDDVLQRIDDRVVGLVYIAALAPDEDETAASQQARFPVTDVFHEIEVADGRVWMLPTGIGYFCGDLPEEEQQVVWATATPPAADLFTQKPTGAAWKTKRSAYVVATQDHSVHPDLRRFSAKRMGAATYEVDSGHCAMLSHPDVVLDAIRNLVTSLQGKHRPAFLLFTPALIAGATRGLAARKRERLCSWKAMTEDPRPRSRRCGRLVRRGRRFRAPPPPPPSRAPSPP